VNFLVSPAKDGSIAPRQEATKVSEAVALFRNFIAAESWVPAFAGKTVSLRLSAAQ